jgi:hypothetical protein
MAYSLGGASVASAVSTWTAPQVISGSDGGSYDLKDPQPLGMPGGGFGVAYWRSGAGDVRYRRIQSDMSFGGNTTVVYQGAFTPNPNMALMNDGSVRVAWEKWNEPNPSGPEVGTRRINNDGSLIAGENAQIISSSGNNAKWPLLSAFGTGNDSRAVMSYWNSSSKSMRFEANAGAAWSGDASTGYSIDNQYVCTGIAKSPIDGSVWRAYGVKTSSSPDTYALRMINFNPNTQTWGAPVTIESGITYFPSRIQLAANWHGKVLVAWDSSNTTSAKIYTPGSGFGSTTLAWTNKSFFGNVAAVPGAPNDWWIFNSYGYGSFPMIRPVVNGVIDPVAYAAEYPSDGFTSNTQFYNPRGAIDPTGRVAYMYESWVGTAKPVIAMSYRNERSYIGGVWLGAGTGNWSDASKWAGTVIPNDPTLTVRLDYGSPANSSATLDQNVAVGSIQVDAGDSFAINPGRTLTIAGTAASALAGNVTNSGALTLQANTATLTSSATHAGVFNVAAGATLNYAGGPHTLNNPTGSFTGNGAVTVTGGSLIAANADTLTGANLTIAAGASGAAQAGLSKALTVGSIVATGSGKFDLRDNSAVIRNMTLAQVQAEIASGYAGGAWNGPGLNSSTAAATTLHVLAFAQNSMLNRSTFKGVSGLNASDVLVKYTYTGDADLSGAVTLDDFTLFLGGYQSGGTTWFQGDFDYNGATTLDDFTLFLLGYQQQGAPLTEIESMIDAMPMSAAERAAMLAAVQAVPEPFGLGVIGVAVAGLLTRRRRHRPADHRPAQHIRASSGMSLS